MSQYDSILDALPTAAILLALIACVPLVTWLNRRREKARRGMRWLHNRVRGDKEGT